MSTAEELRKEKQDAAVLTAVADYVGGGLGGPIRPRDQMAAHNGAAALSREDKIHASAQSDPGRRDATLHPDMHMTLDRVSPLVRKGGTMLATESEFAGYAAMARPDMKVIACEPDPVKFAALQKQYKENGLTNITLLHEKPVDAMERLAKEKTPIDAVTSFYGMQLKTDAEAGKFLSAASKLVNQGASVVVHDLARPHHAATAAAMAGAFPAEDAPPSFAQGYKDGLNSAYTPQELAKRLESSLGNPQRWEHEDGGPAFMQTHTLKGRKAPPEGSAPTPRIPPTNAENNKVYSDLNNAYTGALPLKIGREVLEADAKAGMAIAETGGKISKWARDGIEGAGETIADAGKWAGGKLSSLFKDESPPQKPHPSPIRTAEVEHRPVSPGPAASPGPL